MDDLTTAFAVLLADPPVPPEPITELAGRADRVRRRRRRRRVVGSTAALVVVLVLGASAVVAVRTDDVGLSTDGIGTVGPAGVPADAPTTAGVPGAFPFVPPPGFTIHAEPSSTDLPDGQGVAVTYTASRDGSVVAGSATATVSLTIMRGEPITTAIFVAPNAVELANAYTNETDYRPFVVDGRDAAVRDFPAVSGEPFGVPDQTGSLVVFAADVRTMVQVSASNLTTDELVAVIASIDAELLRTLGENP